MGSFMRIYVGAVIAGGTIALALLAPRELPNPALAVTLLAAMLVVSLFKLRLPLGRGQATLSMAYVIDFLAIVTAGAGVAMVIAAAGVLVQCTVRVRRRQPWYRAAFSIATVVLAVQAAGWTWTVLGGSIAEPGLAATVLPLAIAAMLYFAINTGLVAGAIALSSGVSLGALWEENFLRIAPGFLGSVALLAVLHGMVTRDALVLLPAIAVPMLCCHLAYAYLFNQMGTPPAAEATT
jgi:hypothetical protein